MVQLSWSQHKLAHSCHVRGQRSNGAINRSKHFFRSFCRGISNLVTPSLTVAEKFTKEREIKREGGREGGEGGRDVRYNDLLCHYNDLVFSL